MSRANPFSDFGTIVRQDRFVGREADLQVVESRVVRPNDAGNLAIIGEPRIGKSSLLYKSIMDRRKQFRERRIVPIWINLATNDSPIQFFQSLVERCVDELEEVGPLSTPVQLAAEKALREVASWGDGYARIQRFFMKVRLEGFNVWCLIDEFDHARHLFKGDISGFQGLRELAYHPDWRITLVTASRRSIRDIELQTKAISTLDGIFMKHYLGMFVPADIDLLLSRLARAGIPVTDELRTKVVHYCGGHPLLLEMLCHALVEQQYATGGIDVGTSAATLHSSFIDQYDRIVDLLREDGSLSKLLQILFGPVYDATQSDVEVFLCYGLIQQTDRGTYAAFSPHFQLYLQLIQRQGDLWPLWRETELALRRLIMEMMIRQHGEQWIPKLEKAHPNLVPIFESCRESQRRERSAFGTKASGNLIDFTYPRDLFSIIFAEWSLFRPILGKDKAYWDSRATLLSKLRNPLAHNRDWMLHEHERKLGEVYCAEILAVLGDSADRQA